MEGIGSKGKAKQRLQGCVTCNRNNNGWAKAGLRDLPIEQ